MAQHVKKGSIKETVTKIVLTQRHSFSPASIETEAIQTLKKALGQTLNTKQTREVKLVCGNTIKVLRDSNMLRAIPGRQYELNTRVSVFH